MQTELRKEAEKKLDKRVLNRLQSQEEVLFNGRFIENNNNMSDDNSNEESNNDDDDNNEFNFVEKKNNSNIEDSNLLQ
jgi:hypothetical protein